METVTRITNWLRLVPVTVVLCAAVTEGVQYRHGDGGDTVPVPTIVTADIQAGIERHVEEQVRLGNGYFTLPFKGKDLRLRLVRVHTEYLSNLQYEFSQ